MEEYWTLSVYCRALNEKRENLLNQHAFDESYIDSLKNSLSGNYKKDLSLLQIRNAWLTFLREMFKICYPVDIKRMSFSDEERKEGKDEEGKENNENNNSKKLSDEEKLKEREKIKEEQRYQYMIYESALVYFADLVVVKIFSGVQNLHNPLKNDPKMFVPVGCVRQDLPDQISLPSDSGKRNKLFDLFTELINFIS